MLRGYEQHIEDVSELTGLTKLQVIYLMKISRLLVGHEIYECMVEDSSTYESYCLGVGKLKVEYNSETDDYDISFRLSRDMKNVLNRVLDEQKSPLVDVIDKSLMKDIMNRFKEVIDLE